MLSSTTQNHARSAWKSSVCPSVRLDQVGRKPPDGRDDEDDELGRLEKSLRLGDAMDVRVVAALYGTGYATGYGTGSIGGGQLGCSLAWMHRCGMGLGWVVAAKCPVVVEE